MPPAIEVRGLTKAYGAGDVLQGVDLAVERGEVLALLGPNGAGKTTTVEILEGYRERDAGYVTVLDCDPAAADRSWRDRVGIVLQSAGIDGDLRVGEAVEAFRRYYSRPLPTAEVLDLCGLHGHRRARVKSLSGGQRRRLDLAVGLVGDPEVLFLDEPTTGFDPAARRNAWRMIAALRERAVTVLLTTHYMDEAAALADRVAILHLGRIVAEGHPDELGAGTTIIRMVVAGVEEHLFSLSDTGIRYTLDGRAIVVETTAPVPVVNTLTGWATNEGVAVLDLSVRSPTLEDVYLKITGTPA